MVSNLSRWIQVDFFPNTSQRLRHVFYQPLGILVVASLVSLACGVFLHAQAFSLGGCLLAIVILGTAWPWFCAKGIMGSVSFGSDRAPERQPVAVHLAVTNRLPWPVHGLFIKGGNNGNEDDHRGLSTIPARSIARCSWKWSPPRRGIYPAKPLIARTGFPFGLWMAGKMLDCSSKLTIWPETFPVGPIPRIGPEDMAEGCITMGKAGNCGEFSGARPYRRGDHQRRIHWPLTARHDRLIVRELEAPTRPAAIIFIDNSAPGVDSFGGDATIDWIVRVAASLATGWLDEGVLVGLGWHGGHVPASSGSFQRTRLLDATASIDLVSAGSGRHDWGDHRGQNLLKILVTTEPAHLKARESPGYIEDHRSVVLGRSTTGTGRTPWLRIEHPDSVRTRLLEGWMEARHGD